MIIVEDEEQEDEGQEQDGPTVTHYAQWQKREELMLGGAGPM